MTLYVLVVVVLVLVGARAAWRSEGAARTTVPGRRDITARRTPPPRHRAGPAPTPPPGRPPIRRAGRATARRRRRSSPAVIYPRTEGWARWLDREDVLVVDTETTGRGRDAEALSVAVIDTTGRTRFSEPVMPAGPVPAEATAVHGLTRAKLRAAGARGWPEHHGRVARLMAGAAEVLAYNAAFDRRLLRQTAALYELSLPQARWSCVMLAYAAGGRRSLAAAAEAEGVPVAGAHDALADARTTLDLIRAVAAREAGGGDRLGGSARRSPHAAPHRPWSWPEVAAELAERPGWRRDYAWWGNSWCGPCPVTGEANPPDCTWIGLGDEGLLGRREQTGGWDGNIIVCCYHCSDPAELVVAQLDDVLWQEHLAAVCGKERR